MTLSLSEKTLIESVRARQIEIEKFVLFQLLPKVVKASIRNTKHFCEWYSIPMNYVRIIESPLTFELLDVNKNHKILDISSPKLLPLYMMVKGFKNITVSDVEEYFKEDFQVYSQNFPISPKIETFDARKIPYQDETFDRVFSISVLEHVPGEGDIDISKEVARVLKPEGLFVLTLPAYKVYLEEWVKNPSIYWQTEKDREGRSFYQRRYDESSIRHRFSGLGMTIKDIVYIAEKPIQEPKLNDKGMLLHNVYYLNNLIIVKFLKKLYQIFKIPCLPYISHRTVSKRYHYLTRDNSDPNIRQVAVKFQKEK
jgi:SAM-dependent methyltransferase